MFERAAGQLPSVGGGGDDDGDKERDVEVQQHFLIRGSSINDVTQFRTIVMCFIPKA